MLVHIVADDQKKISELRTLFGSQDRITSALLNDESSRPKECDALIVAVDLRNADSIAALKEVSATFHDTPRRIFAIDQKVRLLAAQAYALGATHVLSRPVYQPSLLAALHGSGKSKALSEDDDDQGGARGAASEGAATLAEDGFSHWLETVRRHHEGTYQHCLLVTGTAAAFGLNLGLARFDMERLYSAAMFHDVGKAKIPLAILDKPGRLDDRERAVIETHPTAGYDALKGTRGISSEILDAVRHHHEYLDGSGYPDALCAADISDVVRILTISDIFAALIEDRRYKAPLSRAEAYEVLCGMRGKLEGPLVGAFKEVALTR